MAGRKAVFSPVLSCDVEGGSCTVVETETLMAKTKKDKMRAVSPDQPLGRIGWREWLALPQLGIPAIKAKIDTGARTSALHTFSLEEFSAGGIRMVRFGIHPLQKRKDIELFCEAPVLERRRVRDSGGHSEKRYVIQTDVVLKNELWRINVTLTNRDAMIFRMLLGRTAVEKRFVIDPGRSYTAGRSLAKNYPRRPGRKGKK
jgi:hypothetical protein